MEDSSQNSRSVEKKNSPLGVLDLYDFGIIEKRSFGSRLMDSMEVLQISPLNKEIKLGKEDTCLSKRETSETSILATLSQIDSLVKDLEENEFGVDKDALFAAASEGNADAILRLLDAGCLKPDLRDPEGATPLHVAARAGRVRAVIALLLVLSSANAGAYDLVNAVDNRKRSALHLAAVGGHVRVAQRLLMGGARLDLDDCNGDTPLLAAAKAGQWSIVELLAEKGALSLPMVETLKCSPIDDVKQAAAVKPSCAATSFLDARDRDGNSALVHAAVAGQWSVVQLLLEKGASPTEYQSPQSAPLAMAVRAGRRDVARQLIMRGATPMCVKDAARLYGIVKANSENGDRWLRRMAQTGQGDALALALVAGCDVNASTAKGRTALHFACHYGRAQCASYLLQRGAHADARDVEGCTPLHYAAFQGHEATVRALLARDARVDAADRNGCTALHWASYNGHADVAKMLLRHGARTDLQDSTGRTALHDASQKGHGEIVVALLQAGANANVQNKNHETPALLARTEDLKQLLSLYSHRNNQS